MASLQTGYRLFWLFPDLCRRWLTVLSPLTLCRLLRGFCPRSLFQLPLRRVSSFLSHFSSESTIYETFSFNFFRIKNVFQINYCSRRFHHGLKFLEIQALELVMSSRYDDHIHALDCLCQIFGEGLTFFRQICFCNVWIIQAGFYSSGF